MPVLPLGDTLTDEVWAFQIPIALMQMGIEPSECVLYYCRKPGDVDIEPSIRKHLEVKFIPQMMALCSSQIRADIDGHINCVHPKIRLAVKKLLGK